MKIKIIITMTLILFLSACGGREKDQSSDLKTLGLKGWVKSIRYSSYSAELKFGEIKKKVRSKSEEDNRYYFFNEKGVKIEEGSFYDRIQRKRIYKYNDKGELIQTSDFDSKDEFMGKTIYLVDEKGRLTETNEFNFKNEFTEKIIYTRDEKGNIIEKNSYDSMGNLRSKFKFEYDKKGRILESIYDGLDGEPQKKTYLKYDSKGRMVELKLVIGTSVFIENLKYEDKEKDDITLMIKSQNYSIISKTIYRYKYDEKGNWIQKISIEDEKPKIIEEREIKYYM